MTCSPQLGALKTLCQASFFTISVGPFYLASLVNNERWTCGEERGWHTWCKVIWPQKRLAKHELQGSLISHRLAFIAKPTSPAGNRELKRDLKSRTTCKGFFLTVGPTSSSMAFLYVSWMFWQRASSEPRILFSRTWWHQSFHGFQ